MKSYRDERGVFHRTQADAKASGFPFELVDIPTDHAGLIDFVNRLSVPVPPPAPAPTPDEASPYRNGDPTRPFMGSRDPSAIFTCTTCGANNRNP